MLNREVLQTIANSPSSTELERDEALAALQRMDAPEVRPQTGPSPEDDELLSWLSPKHNALLSERIETRARLSLLSRQILDDFCDALLACPPAHGAEERMTALLDRQRSDIVRSEAQRALRHIAAHGKEK
jgi:hypothetical protein